jgi:hypothetical protein
MRQFEEHLAYEIASTERAITQGTLEYAKACEWLARDLTTAATKAREAVGVSASVMSSSLVHDITRHAQNIETLAGKLKSLRDVQRSLTETKANA